MPAATEPARASDLLLDGFATLLTAERSEATPLLQRAVRCFAGDDAPSDEVLRWGWVATVAAVAVWDYERCVAIASRGVQLARDAGALTVLAVALHINAQAVTMAGDFGLARQLISEADTVAGATGTEIGAYGALYLGAFEGREPAVSNLIDRTIREATRGGQGTAVQFASFAEAAVLNARGRYREALTPGLDASEHMPELIVAGWALTELVEAASRSGEPELGRRALERLAERNQFVATDWGRGLEARARALLTETDAAEDLYREAIERLGRTPLRPEVARAHLVYGEWLRRQNRRVDARAELRAAYEQSTSIGMQAFAERARRELLATGEKLRKRGAEARDDLTPQERQIAQMAGDGLSNPAIGARLFLSPRTVEWHLRKVFAKLEIHHRGELADALGEGSSSLSSAPARA